MVVFLLCSLSVPRPELQLRLLQPRQDLRSGSVLFRNKSGPSAALLVFWSVLQPGAPHRCSLGTDLHRKARFYRDVSFYRKDRLRAARILNVKFSSVSVLVLTHLL